MSDTSDKYVVDQSGNAAKGVRGPLDTTAERIVAAHGPALHKIAEHDTPDDAALAAAEACANKWRARGDEPVIGEAVHAEHTLEAVAIARRLQAENAALTERLQAWDGVVIAPCAQCDTTALNHDGRESHPYTTPKELRERLRVAEAERDALKISLMFARAVEAPTSDAAPKKAHTDLEFAERLNHESIERFEKKKKKEPADAK